MSSVSTFTGLQTALRGILAHQRAIDTTGHNVANANTEGYSRQTAEMSTTLALPTPGRNLQGGMIGIGTGVEVVAYSRIRDSFLDVQYRAQSMQLGYNQSSAKSLDQVELALAEPGDTGLQSQLDKFWSAWSDVANSPDGIASRQALLDQADGLADTFRQIDAQLTTVAGQASAEYAAITGPQGEVLQLANEIAGLNNAIGQFVAMGDTPNDLLDRRDLLLDKLSALSQVSTTDNGNGTIGVTFGNIALINGATGTTVNWPSATFATTTGKLGALNDVSKPGGIVASYRTALNTAAKTLADTVNAAYNPSSTAGGNFFSYTAGSEASTLAVVIASPTALKTSANPSTPYANDLALAVGALRGGAADAAYSAFVSRIANDVNTARRQETNAQALVDAVDDRRQSISGVSLDEEMTNMVRFQRGFQASARAMSTVDDMIDQLINRTGRVGL
jgi:flagellar hook-associated protein 1 FlgK